MPYTATRSPRSWGLASVEAAGLPSKSPERRHLLITPPLPCFFLCCHKLVSLRWCTGLMLMLIMLMPANTMAASQNYSEFYGAWFVIRPANQKWEPFSPMKVPGTLVWTQHFKNYLNYTGKSTPVWKRLMSLSGAFPGPGNIRGLAHSGGARDFLLGVLWGSLTFYRGCSNM